MKIILSRKGFDSSNGGCPSPIMPDGTLDYRKDRILTMEGMGRATWNEYEFLLPEHLYGKKKNCAKGKGLYYAGIWQEQVVYESEGLMDWVKKVIM